MKSWTLYTLLAGGLLLHSACTSEKSDDKPAVSAKLSNEESIDAEIKAVDENAERSGLVANSLSYSKESGEAVEVLAHLSDNHEILKLEEKFSDGEGKNNGIITYYMKGKLPFATREYFEDYSDPKGAKFVDRISYYDAKGKVLSTKEKRVNYEEDLAAVQYVPAPLHSCSVDRAMQVLDQKGAYATTFQGFAIAEPLNYLIVGQPGNDGFTSALRIEDEDAFIIEAIQNQKRYLNRKCRVSFTLAENSGYTYQVYTGGQWVFE